MKNAEAVTIEIAEEDGLRADMYDFIASLLRTEPTDELIAQVALLQGDKTCLLYTSPSPRDGLLSRMPSSA